MKPGLIGVSLGTLGGECDVGHMGGCRLTQARQQLQIVTRRGPIAALRHASVDVQPSCHATRCSPAVYHASRAHGGGLRGRDSYRTGPAIQFVPLPVSRLRLELGTPTELIQDSHHAANFSVWYPGQALPNTRSFFPVLRGNCGTRARLASGDVLSNIATTWTSKTVLKGAKKSREEVVAPTTSGISGGLASAVFTRKYRRQFSGFLVAQIVAQFRAEAAQIRPSRPGQCPCTRLKTFNPIVSGTFSRPPVSITHHSFEVRFSRFARRGSATLVLSDPEHVGRARLPRALDGGPQHRTTRTRLSHWVAA